MATVDMVGINPTSTNGLDAAGLSQAVQLAERLVFEKLADQTDIFNSPVIVTIGDVLGGGSDVLRSRFADWGWATSMDATANEDTDVSATSFDGAAVDVTVTRRALRMDETQLAQIVGGAWGFDPEAIAMRMVASFRAGRMSALATTIAGASTNVSSSSTGTLDDWLDVVDSFVDATAYSGPIVALCAPQTMQSVRDDLRAEVGPTKERLDVQMLQALGAEELYGVAAIPYTGITTSGGNYENAFMIPGAISYAVGSPSGVVTNVQAMRPSGLPLVIDIEPNASAGTVEIIGNGYDGQAIREQARIRGFLAST